MFFERGYLLDVTHRTPQLSVLHELLDILAACNYNAFYLYSESGSEVPLPDLGRVGAYCEMQGLAFASIGPEQVAVWKGDRDTVLVSTESPRSLAGRVEEMRERMGVAEERGRREGSRRFIVTDFSDGCAWQPIVVSLPGIVLGGALAASGRKAVNMDLENELNRFLGAPIGGLVLKLGTLYLRGGAVRPDSSEFFNILVHDHGYSRHPGLTDSVLEEVGAIAQAVAVEAERWVARSDWAIEVVYMASLLDCACHRRNERCLRELREAHGRIWRLRFNPEGRVASLSRLPRF